MSYDVLIRKNSTGEVGKCHFEFDWFKEDSDDSFWWTEGNFSCDCNREIVFERAVGNEIGNEQCGFTQFTAIQASLPDGRVIALDEVWILRRFRVTYLRDRHFLQAG